MVYSEVPNFSEPNPDYRGQQNKGVINPNVWSVFMIRLILTMYYNSMVRLPALPYPKHDEDNLKRNPLEIIFILYVCESAYVFVVSYIKYICHLAL